MESRGWVDLYGTLLQMHQSGRWLAVRCVWAGVLVNGVRSSDTHAYHTPDLRRKYRDLCHAVPFRMWLPPLKRYAKRRVSLLTGLASVVCCRAASRPSCTKRTCDAKGQVV